MADREEKTVSGKTRKRVRPGQQQPPPANHLKHNSTLLRYNRNPKRKPSLEIVSRSWETSASIGMRFDHLMDPSEQGLRSCVVKLLTMRSRLESSSSVKERQTAVSKAMPFLAMTPNGVGRLSIFTAWETPSGLNLIIPSTEPLRRTHDSSVTSSAFH